LVEKGKHRQGIYRAPNRESSTRPLDRFLQRGGCGDSENFTNSRGGPESTPGKIAEGALRGGCSDGKGKRVRNEEKSAKRSYRPRRGGGENQDQKRIIIPRTRGRGN